MRHLATICLVLAVYCCHQAESGSRSGTSACAKGVGVWKKGKQGYYINCSRGSDGLVTGVRYKCPYGTAFDDTTKTCTPATTSTVTGGRKKRQTSSTPPDCNGRMVSCANCSSIRICQQVGASFIFLEDQICPAATPYCNNNAPNCSTKVPETCPTNFTCTSPGVFPDPTDCTMYHFCYEDDLGNLVDDGYYCDPNQVFTGSIEDCWPVSKGDAVCHTITCPAIGTTMMPFPSERKYYVLCVSGQPKYVFRCPDYTGFESTTTRCEPGCNYSEAYPDFTDPKCRAYFLCSGPGTKPQPRTCRVNNYFSKVTLTCVAGTCPTV